MTVSDAQRHVAPALVQALLSYVQQVGGAAAFEAVATASPVPLAELVDSNRWFSSGEAIEIAEAAGRVCHDEHIGVRAGTQLWWLLCQHDGYIDLVRSAGSIPEAIAAAARRGTKTSTGRVIEVGEVGDDHLLLVARYSDLSNAHRFYCGMSAGYYSQVPRAFGMWAEAVELQCQLDGADECVYRIVWRVDAHASAPDEQTLAASSDRSQHVIDQLEQMHQLTSQLLSTDRVDEVLARITAEAGRAVQAPRYVLAVRVNDRDRLRVHQQGFRQSSADNFALRLLDGSVGEADGVLWADVVYDDRHYGRLAACYPRGSSFADRDRRLLAAYARHAAAVLGHVTSLEQAAADRDTARALLDLARSIAGASTVAEVAHRLVDTVPRVVESDTATIWVWDAEHDELVLAAYGDAHETTEFTGPHRLVASELDDLRKLAASPSPLLLDVDTVGEPVRGMLNSSGVRRVAVVPVTIHGEFAGVVCAGFRRDLPEEERLLTRLAGLADHAAVALQSVRLVERISHNASHDALTGLANREKLREEADKALTRARAQGRRVALLFIDLDRFKNVNDTLGHAAGDDLIRQVGERIREVTRPTDVLARLGGDEFLLVLGDLPDNEVAEATARRVVEVLRTPFTLQRQNVYVSCSVGVACYPDHGPDYATLLQHADAAMYDAKAAGRNSAAVFTGLAHPAEVGPGLAVESQLHVALANDELEVHYQPQFALDTGAIVAVEALVRWRHPAFGLLGPGSFLAIAEESGLISDIDRRVRAIAFRQTRLWHDAGWPLRLAVNLAARDLHQRKLAELLTAELAAVGLSPGALEVEITDRVDIDEQTLAGVLDQLQAAGMRIAIDDFGTGTSVLGRLHRCAVHTLKIDRSFIKDIDQPGEQPVIVAALTSLARTMGIATVVEGVENIHQLNAVRTCGADLAQGFLLSRPVAADDLTALLTEARLRVPALVFPLTG